jgi:hypothetical protein
MSSSCDFADGLFVKKKDPFRDAFPNAAEDAVVNLANLKKMGEWVQNELRPAVRALGKKAGVKEAESLGLPELCARRAYVEPTAPPASIAISPDSLFFEDDIPRVLAKVRQLNRRSRYPDDTTPATGAFPH